MQQQQQHQHHQQHLLSLLQRATAELQRWQAAVACSGAALGVLQGVLGALHSEQPAANGKQQHTGAALPVHTRLMELAPSFALEAYISGQQQQQPGSSSPAEQLHAALGALHDAVAAARAASAGLSELSEQMQEQVCCTPSSLPQQQPEQVELLGTGSSALPCDVAAATAAGGNDGGTADEEGPPADCPLLPSGPLQPEELALLLAGVASGVQRDAQWMAAAAADISLETPPAALATLDTFWQLQPFTNEAAVDSLMQEVEGARAQAVVPGGGTGSSS